MFPAWLWYTEIYCVQFVERTSMTSMAALMRVWNDNEIGFYPPNSYVLVSFHIFLFSMRILKRAHRGKSYLFFPNHLLRNCNNNFTNGCLWESLCCCDFSGLRNGTGCCCFYWVTFVTRSRTEIGDWSLSGWFYFWWCCLLVIAWAFWCCRFMWVIFKEILGEGKIKMD